MIRFAAILVFFAHFAALKGPKPLRTASRIVFGLPSGALLLLNLLANNPEYEDVFYYLPLLILVPFLLAEAAAFALKQWQKR